MMGLPSRVPKSCCWTPDFCFEEVCPKSNPPMAVMKTRAHARISRLGIMAKSVLREGSFVMCAHMPRLPQSAVRVEFIPAGVAHPVLPQIDPLHRVGRCHSALIILAMTQLKRVPEFVDGFFQQPLTQQGVILIQTVKLLPQPECRHDCARPAHLRLAENIFKNRDIKIDLGHGEKAPVSWPNQVLHALQDFRRVKLLALGMIARSWVQRERENFAANQQSLRNGVAQVVEQSRGNFADREQMNEIH